MLRIEYYSKLPVEVRMAIEPHITKWAHRILPGWCDVLNVSWADGETRGALFVEIHMEYRRVDLFVAPNFLSSEQLAVRERQVVHELMHVNLEPLDNCARDLESELGRRCPELVPWMKEALRYASESTVCDLTTAFFRE